MSRITQIITVGLGGLLGGLLAVPPELVARAEGSVPSGALHMTAAEVALVPLVLSFLCSLLANVVSPSSVAGKIIHFIGGNGPAVQAIITAAEKK